MAIYARKTKTAKRRSYRRKTVSKVSSRKSTSNLKKIIQSVVSKNVEDKIAYATTGDSLVYHNSGINSSADIYQCIPTIPVGSTESHRIGCRVRAKTLVIRGYIQLEPDVVQNNADNKRVGVRLMVFSSRKFKSMADLQANAGGALINKGNVSQSFNGNISDLWAPINVEEYIKYYDKVHYLSQSYIGYQAGSSVSMIYPSDMGKGIKFFVIRVPVKGKLLHFDASTSTGNPTNYSVGLAMGYAHLNGASPDTVSTKVGICFDTTFTYEDA